MTMHPQEKIRLLNEVVNRLIQERTELVQKNENLRARVAELEGVLQRTIMYLGGTPVIDDVVAVLNPRAAITKGKKA